MNFKSHGVVMVEYLLECSSLSLEQDVDFRMNGCAEG